jgi:hypothetical protein
LTLETGIFLGTLETLGVFARETLALLFEKTNRTRVYTLAF